MSNKVPFLAKESWHADFTDLRGNRVSTQHPQVRLCRRLHLRIAGSFNSSLDPYEQILRLFIFQQIADFGQQHLFGRRCGRRRRCFFLFFLQPIIGANYQEDDKGDNQEIDDRLQE